jgi:hypothetical protein
MRVQSNDDETPPSAFLEDGDNLWRAEVMEEIRGT